MKKIVVLHFGGLGDMVISMPALEVLRKLYCNDKIILITTKSTLPLIENSNIADDIIGLGFKQEDVVGINIVRNYKLMFSLFQFFYSLRKEKIDIMINFSRIDTIWGAIKMALIFYLVNARYRIGRNTGGLGFFYNYKISEPSKPKKHEFDYVNDIIRKLGGEVKGFPKLSPDDKSIKEVENMFKEHGIGGNDILVCFNCSARREAARWPIESFIYVMSSLKNVKILIIGGNEKYDIEIAKNIKSMVSHVVDFSGKTTVKQLIALLSRVHLVVTNDTGVLHIAAALSTPVVAIFGPASPLQYKPLMNEEKCVVYYKPVECSPCSKHKCWHRICLRAIHPEEVLEGIRILLGRMYKHLCVIMPPELEGKEKVFKRERNKKILERVYLFLRKRMYKLSGIVFDEKFYSVGYITSKVRDKVVEIFSKSIDMELERILEVGCGEGLLLCELAQKFPKVEFVGIDVRRDILKECERRAFGLKLSNVVLQQATGECLPFPDEFFDITVCVNTFMNIQSLESIRNVILEMHRVTRTRGYIIFEIRNRGNIFFNFLYKYAYLYDTSLFCRGKSKSKITTLYREDIKKIVHSLYPKKVYEYPVILSSSNIAPSIIYKIVK